MPTIKTSGGKVLLKGGKVSCSCCAGGCCLYPAIGTTFADVPETLVLTIVDTETVIPLTKYDDGGSPGYEGDPGSGMVPLVRVVDGFWSFGESGSLGSSGCLIVNDGPFTVEDEFSSGYSIEGTWDFNGMGEIEPIGVEVQREEFPNNCSWRSGKDGAFFTLRYNSTSLKWEFSVDEYPEEILQKDDPQDSPVGNYGSSEHLFDVEIL